MTNIAIENDHRNSGFSHWKWWFSIAMLIYQRVIRESCHELPHPWMQHTTVFSGVSGHASIFESKCRSLSLSAASFTIHHEGFRMMCDPCGNVGHHSPKAFRRVTVPHRVLLAGAQALPQEQEPPWGTQQKGPYTLHVGYFGTWMNPCFFGPTASLLEQWYWPLPLTIVCMWTNNSCIQSTWLGVASAHPEQRHHHLLWQSIPSKKKGNTKNSISDCRYNQISSKEMLARGKGGYAYATCRMCPENWHRTLEVPQTLSAGPYCNWGSGAGVP